MSRTDFWRCAVRRQGLGAILTLVLILAWGAGLAWAQPSASLGGAAQPVPTVTHPIIGQVYDVRLVVTNTSFSLTDPPGTPTQVGVFLASSILPPTPDGVAHIILACSASPCTVGSVTQLPGTVLFLPQPGNGCVSSTPGVTGCILDPADPTNNTILIETNPNAVTLGPGGAIELARIRVQQVTAPGAFLMGGDTVFQGIAGTCVGATPGNSDGQCSNVAPSPPGLLPNHCATNSDCDFSSVAGTGGGSANLAPEECAVRVDKQVSCDGVQWFDQGLESADGDGPNGTTCTVNSPVFVRYQAANISPTIDVQNCTLSESNSVIGGVIQQGFGILRGQTTPFTAADSNQTCTTALTAQEPDTATLACECVVVNPTPIVVTAFDAASVSCQATCGDGVVGDTPGETCDPPGSEVPGHPGVICRSDCTFCGDNVIQSNPNATPPYSEQCDDGNNTAGDGCSPTCTTESCEVQVDKQVSCDGQNWVDAGLVTGNEDGTNSVMCPRNEPVFVRYQAQNTGQATATCTATESNASIEPGGTVIGPGQVLNPGQLLGPTNPLNPSCTDTLAANEPDHVNLACTCPNGTGGIANATATDTAAIICQPRCGDGIIDPGETCDGNTFPANAPATHGPCRAPGTPGECTFCGDAHVNNGEQCDDGNAINGDGCSTSCTTESCSVQVDKQVSCDGMTWVDVGLVTGNEDGTGMVTCPGGAPVFVRYQVANTGQVNVANCTLSESNLVINPGGVVQSGISILAGQTLPETTPDSDQTCTDALQAQEPNTATLSCECQLSQGGPLTVTATDTAAIACQVTVGICRTPGFWAEHAGTEKRRSVNITQAVIDAAPGGCIVICGEKITNTDTDSANSALEALCVTGQLQLPRQLMAAALNCIMTNGNADCKDTGIEEIFQACNAACPASKKVVIGPNTINCIDAIDCFNNGGDFDPATGACTAGQCISTSTGQSVGPCGEDQVCPLGSQCVPNANNCHDQPLCNEDLGLCFEPPGPAGSTSACNEARHNSCAIIPPGEAQCATGTKNAAPETCP